MQELIEKLKREAHRALVSEDDTITIEVTFDELIIMAGAVAYAEAEEITFDFEIDYGHRA